jgi:CheY-like chemotaxis protein
VAYRIIVADPSPSAQKAVQLAFPEPEFRLFPFEDGAELLDALDEIRPDAVLLSLSLPGRDAAEVGRFMRSREGLRRVPLLLLKGSFEALEAGKAPPPEHDEVVQKPFDSERLTASVRDLIEKKMSPSTIPEEPVWPQDAGPASSAGPHESRSLPEDPALPAGSETNVPPASSPGPVDKALREWIRAEFYGTEKEIEKRVRVHVLADLKEWLAGDGKDAKGTV